MPLRVARFGAGVAGAEGGGGVHEMRLRIGTL